MVTMAFDAAGPLPRWMEPKTDRLSGFTMITNRFPTLRDLKSICWKMANERRWNVD